MTEIEREDMGVQQPGPPISVILIEDEEGARELLTLILRNLDCEVRACADGEEGLREQRMRPADIVVSDIRMRGIDGMEVLRRVRENWPHTEVILITGYATVEAAVEALRHGAYDLLLKPIRMEQIEPVVRHCAERVRYARENLELRRVVDRLRELSARKEKFVALANHELRTPTAVACGLVGLLKKRTDLSPEAAELVDRTDTALQRLRELVNDIGCFAMSRSDDQWLIRSPTQVGEIFEDLRKLCGEYAGLRRIELSAENRTDPGKTVNVDRAKMLRAMDAILQNAVKFTPDGGRVEVRLDAEAGNIEFSVADNGVGVPPEEVRRIFDLFYKVGDPLGHRTSSHEFGGGGMGIGLPLARTIARAHEGDVRYRPRDGGGSVFTITVPCGEN